MKYLLAFIIVFLIVYILIPPLKRLALKIDFVDRPTKRKKHSNPTALLGGIGIFVGFIVGFCFFVRPVDKKFYCILIGSFLILAIGLVDDFYKTKSKDFSVTPRLIIQIFCAVIAYMGGIVFKGFTNPFSHQYIILPTFAQFLLTITWIFGVTTVINWSDGMDGLAGSLSTISSITLFIVALVKGQPESAMMSIMLAAASLGFLKYNKHPAEIFMGDSGSTFIGFILSIIALDGAFKQATVVSIFVPILTLGVPIFDNLFVVIRRFVNGKPIYKADATQIHHRLLSTGLTQKQVVTFISLVSICLSLLSLIVLILNL